MRTTSQFHFPERAGYRRKELRLEFSGGLHYLENMADRRTECDFYRFYRPTLDSFIPSAGFKTWRAVGETRSCGCETGLLKEH